MNNLKLKVRFQYPSNTSSAEASATTSKAGLSENVEILRNRLARNASSQPPAVVDGESSPEEVFKELVSLRTKYSTVVEYTVQLTAERDAIVAQLEDLQREYSKEVGSKLSEGSGKTGRDKDKDISERRVVQQVPHNIH